MTHGTSQTPSEPTADRTDELASRLDAVERTLTGTDTDVTALEDVAAIEARIADLESTVESLSTRLDEVDAATQAVRGYVGGVRTVNEDVERRANAALAKAESLESVLVDESVAGIGETESMSSESAPNRTNSETQHQSRSDIASSRPMGTHTRSEPSLAHERMGSAHDGDASRPHTHSESGHRNRGEQTDDTRRGLAARLRDAL